MAIKNSSWGMAHIILDLLNNSRGSGNTTLMRDGIVKYDRPFLIISTTNAHAQTLAKFSDNPNARGASVLSASDLSVGNRLPMVFDHRVIFNVLTGLIGEINIELDKNGKLIDLFGNSVETIELLVDLTEAFQEQSHTLDRLCLELIQCPWWKFKKIASIKAQMKEKSDEYCDQSSHLESILSKLLERGETRKLQIKKIKDVYN